MAETDMSPALAMIAHCMDHGYDAFKVRSDISRRDLSFAAIGAAIKMGLRFDRDDFSRLQDIAKTRCAYFSHYYVDLGEWIYSEACSHPHHGGHGRAQWINTSACVAYEKFIGRKPFILDGARLWKGAQFDLAPQGLTEILPGGRERTATLDDGDWWRFEITGFDDDQKAFRAKQVFRKERFGDPDPKRARLFRFTREFILAQRAPAVGAAG